MLQNLKKKAEGFTIVEVMIVLAIAGLIILIVFLAVPALQRNSRNNARNQDASRIASATTECLANHNGLTAQCTGGQTGTITVGAGQLSRIDTISVNGGTPSATNAVVTFDAMCNAAGTGHENTNTAGSRAFTVRYVLEPNTPRCISS